MTIHPDALASSTGYIQSTDSLAQFKNQGRGFTTRALVLPAPYEAALTRFLNTLMKRAATKRIYAAGTRHYLAFVGTCWPDLPLESMTREHVETWVNFLRDEGGYGDSTVRSMVQSARVFCRYLVDRDDLDANPFDHIKGLPQGATPDIDILTVEDVTAMLAATKGDKSVWGRRNRALILTLFYGGLRRGELLGMQAGDISWDRQTLRIREQKGGGGRTIGLDWRAMEALDQYDASRKKYVAGLRPYRQKRLEADGVFWLSQRGAALGENGLTETLVAIAKKAGVDKPVHPHSWRHAAATADADGGMGDMELRDRYGWSPKSAMPWRYSRQTLRDRTIKKAHGVRGDDGLKL